MTESERSHSIRVELTVTEILVETLVDSGERLQSPVLTCRGQKKQNENIYNVLSNMQTIQKCNKQVKVTYVQKNEEKHVLKS